MDQMKGDPAGKASSCPAHASSERLLCSADDLQGPTRQQAWVKMEQPAYGVARVQPWPPIQKIKAESCSAPFAAAERPAMTLSSASRRS